MSSGKTKYSIIAKVSGDKFVKYRNVTNLKKFADFLDTRFPSWKYFNVFDSVTGDQVESYTKNKRP
jgi:hypothetical protein